MRIHRNLRRLKPSDTLTISQISNKRQREGQPVYKFGFGQSPFPVPEIVIQALKDNAHQKDYLPVQGLELLRKKIAAHTNQLLNDSNYNSENIFLGPGSKELIYLAQLAIDAPLLVPNPSWVSYEPQAHIIGKKIHWIPTKPNYWKLEAEHLEAYLEAHQIREGILILNYPNNPTGQTFSTFELKNLAEVCRQYNIAVISDEIYGLLQFDGEYESIANYYPEGSIITTGISKWAGAGGWRLGAMIIPDNFKSLYKTMKALASETFSAVSAPIQYAAVEAYSVDLATSNYQKASRYILDTIGNYCYQTLKSGEVEVQAAEGGFYLFPNFTGMVEVDNSVLLCQRLLEETGVALLPGSSFGRPIDELTVRLCFVDFDGQVALSHYYKYGDIKDSDIPKLFPNMLNGMNRLMKWIENN